MTTIRRIVIGVMIALVCLVVLWIVSAHRSLVATLPPDYVMQMVPVYDDPPVSEKSRDSVRAQDRTIILSDDVWRLGPDCPPVSDPSMLPCVPVTHYTVTNYYACFLDPTLSGRDADGHRKSGWKVMERAMYSHARHGQSPWLINGRSSPIRIGYDRTRRRFVLEHIVRNAFTPESLTAVCGQATR